jgi:hypothetical protein
LALKDSRTCDVCELIKKMDVLSELVVDLQASSARGAAQMSLAMCLAHAMMLNIGEVTHAFLRIPTRTNSWMSVVGIIPGSLGASATMHSMTRSCFLLMRPSKRRLRKHAKRKQDMPDPGMGVYSHGQAPRRWKRTRPKLALRVLLLRPTMRRSKKLVPAEKNMNNASFAPFVGL